MHHSFNVLVLNILLHVSAFQNAIMGIRYEHAKMVPNVVKSRDGWELYIVTDGIMFGIISRPLRRLSQYTAPILLCFSRH
jgi:hypothetical protein